jgi:hypothetical protein
MLSLRIGAIVAGAALLAHNVDMLSSFQGDTFWPPSLAAAPFLSMLVTAISILIAIVFFYPSASSATANRVLEDKRKQIMAQLSQAVKWDREDEEDEETEEAKQKKTEKEKEKKKKRPPESKDLFEMLYDDVEERHVIEHGIDAECAEYRGALSLFKERLVPDVEEAARCTRLACEMPEVGDAEMNDDPKRVALFRDGARLKELVRIYEKKIARHFGKGLVPPHTFEAAKATLRTIEAGQRGGGVAVLLELLRPQLPLYALSLLLMAFDSAVGPATWHGVAALFDGIADGSTPLDSFGDTVMQTFATLTLCIFAHLTSWAITHRVTARFSNAVRSEVLPTLS